MSLIVIDCFLWYALVLSYALSNHCWMLLRSFLVDMVFSLPLWNSRCSLISSSSRRSSMICVQSILSASIFFWSILERCAMRCWIVMVTSVWDKDDFSEREYTERDENAREEKNSHRESLLYRMCRWLVLCSLLSFTDLDSNNSWHGFVFKCIWYF